MTSNLMTFTFCWGGRQQTSQIRGVLDVEKAKNEAGRGGVGSREAGAGQSVWERGWPERRQREGGVQVKAEDSGRWALIHPGEEFWAARTHAPERTARTAGWPGWLSPASWKKQGPRDRVRGGRSKSQIGVGVGGHPWITVKTLLLAVVKCGRATAEVGAEPVHELPAAPWSAGPGMSRVGAGRLGGAPCRIPMRDGWQSWVTLPHLFQDEAWLTPDRGA